MKMANVWVVVSLVLVGWTASGGLAQPDIVQLDGRAAGASVSVSGDGKVVLADVDSASFVTLKWNRKFAGDAKVLGGMWERTYGDSAWRRVDDRTAPRKGTMPWYFLVNDGGRTDGYGVMVQPNAFASWTVSEKGIVVSLDVRAGLAPVRPRGRRIELCTLVFREGKPGESAFAAGRAFCRMMCPSPRLPKEQVYGYNDWYCAYGNNTATNFLADAAFIVSLLDRGEKVANRPFFVVDDGWQLKPQKGDAIGPDGQWCANNPRWGMAMGTFAAKVKALDARPGLWYRPFHPDDGEKALPVDPTDPVWERNLRRDLARFRAWGFELVKIDFITWDWGQTWGYELGDSPCGAKACVWKDDAHTGAETVKRLYRAMREAAGDDMYIIGCNAIDHFAAGLFELQRTGDDTDGRGWARTRKMGPNTIGMRSIQNRTFYLGDGDCVGLVAEGLVPWEKNRQWLDLVAKSGTSLFVSWKRALAQNEQVACALSEALKTASCERKTGEPLDWLDEMRPKRWRFDGFGETAYDWDAISFHDGQNGYRTTEMSNVLIRAGSALDLTAVGARDDRWMGFVAGWWQVEPLFERDPADYGGDWKKTFDDYAVQIRRQGFNFFRFHGLLDAGYKAFDHFDVPPSDYMDKVDYLAYTLGKHGVRLYVDLVAYGMRYPKRARKNIDLKAGVMFGVPRYLEQWEKCVRAVLGHTNPYTGKMWKDDENIVAVCQFNEQSTGAKIGLEAAWKGLDPETKAFFLKNWKDWMVKNGRAKEEELSAFTVDTPLPAFYAAKGFGRDLHLYMSELSVERTKWYDRICRDAGYRGLRSSFNSNVDWGACAARWSAGDAVPYNIHQGHPHGGGHGYKGAKVDCNDSFQRSVEGSSFCYGNRIKAADRPFIVTEFSHAFWNPNRYQVGLITAYHALNGYKGLLWHAGGTQLKATGAWPRGGVGVFEVGTSPCMRAAAFLASCLYLRGDVRTSETRVSVAVTKDYWRQHTADAPSSSQARIGLVCNYGIEFPDLPRTPGLGAYPKADLTIAPGTGDEVENGLWVSNVKGKGMADFDMDAFVAKLKAKGLVKPDNRTNAKKGVYESETGELLMKGYEHYLQAVTPRTEAVCLEAGTSAKLDKMEVRLTSVNGCIALTSIDGAPIGASKRMVFLYITREANEGMVTSADGKTMVNMGGYPALLQTGTVDVRLDLSARDWQLYLLGYDGERLERLPLLEEDGKLVLKLDTAKFRHGPTPFFELVKMERPWWKVW